MRDRQVIAQADSPAQRETSNRAVRALHFYFDARCVNRVQFCPVSIVPVFQMNSGSAIAELSISRGEGSGCFNIQGRVLFTLVVLKVEINRNQSGCSRLRREDIMRFARINILKRRAAPGPGSFWRTISLRILCLAIGKRLIQ